MTTKQLEQIFNDNSDCYADTWEDSGGEMHNGCHMMREGESISAMTLPKFIEVVSKILDEKTEYKEMPVCGIETVYTSTGPKVYLQDKLRTNLHDVNVLKLIPIPLTEEILLRCGSENLINSATGRTSFDIGSLM